MIAQMIDQLIEQTLIEVLNMSLTASVMILAVCLARLVLKQAPRIFSYMLWLVVLFRLLCPVSFEAEVSLLGALDAASATEGRMAYIPQDIGYQMEPEVQLPVPALEATLNDSLPAGNPQGSVNPLLIVLYLAGRLWILGMLVMLVYSSVSLWKLRRRLKVAVWEQDNIYRLPGRATPFVYGLFRPRIYIPEHVKEEEQEYILLHEQIHIRRGDPVYRVLAYLALCIHWFNPFVWLAFSFSGKDMEISCDEAVIQQMGNRVKKEYSASLLNAAAGQQIVKGIPLAFGESDTGSRIKHVLRYKKPAKILVGLAAALCVILAVFLAANPAEDDGEIAFYGIVQEVDWDEAGVAQGTTGMKMVYIPGVGNVHIPKSETYYFKTQEVRDSFPVAGDLLKISFPENSEVLIQESDPAAFTEDARRITVLEEDLSIKYQGYDYFLLGLPKHLLEDAEKAEGARDIAEADLQDVPEIVKVGDMLQILRTYPDREELLVASAEVLLVDETYEQFWVELTRSEVEWFLTEYEMGMHFEVERGIQQQEDAGQKKSEVMAEELSQVKDSWDFNPLDIEDGTYMISIRSIARSARVIDRYVCNVELEEFPELAFTEDCEFLSNTGMDSVQYEKLSFDEFADVVNDKGEWTNAPCYLTFENGLITKAMLKSVYFKYGISYEPYSEYSWLEDVQKLPEMEGVDVLETYYTLAETVNADVGDGRGTERIEVYTGNIGDGNSGFVMFYNEQGELLHSEHAHSSRAGWNTAIYS